ncbi:hypothetical protein BDQ12DRAFT_669508 [Crucibulum laeve]|uniref:Uncharacterized protein n=1 Tax=Crucibulum laeve TaxID=68775 RepID=A0A5C3LMD9_9AGAR|nr:hypothetical protein BDQ12DRAFT_669508 [Crucibulum laeve]
MRKRAWSVTVVGVFENARGMIVNCGVVFLSVGERILSVHEAEDPVRESAEYARHTFNSIRSMSFFQDSSTEAPGRFAVWGWCCSLGEVVRLLVGGICQSVKRTTSPGPEVFINITAGSDGTHMLIIAQSIDSATAGDVIEIVSVERGMFV